MTSWGPNETTSENAIKYINYSLYYQNNCRKLNLKKS